MLIEDLLILAQAKRATIHLQTVDLSAEIDDIAGQLQREQPSRDVRFIIQRLVNVRSDPSLIRTVLRNLVENAWKFTSRRDHALIEFGTAPTGDASVCCYVRDNGIGFDIVNTSTLFEAIPAAAFGQRVPRHGYRPGQRPGDRGTSRGPRVGRGQDRRRRGVLLHYTPVRHEPRDSGDLLLRRWRSDPLRYLG